MSTTKTHYFPILFFNSLAQDFRDTNHAENGGYPNTRSSQNVTGGQRGTLITYRSVYPA